MVAKGKPSLEKSAAAHLSAARAPGAITDSTVQPEVTSVSVTLRVLVKVPAIQSMRASDAPTVYDENLSRASRAW